ncbi:MAG: winged helix-turn-helix transcriptional regulator, partial [Clostridia bacterium]|nr:winged helix-turn-helix transcriptional regulator [Clostridia bacterium]
MKVDELEYLRKNQKRTTMVIANQLSKAFEDSMNKMVESPILKEKTARTALIYLSYKNGVTQQELVRVTQMKGSTVSIAISNLEKQGYVTKEANEYDMRSVKIYITSEGRRLATQIEAVLKDFEK